MPPAMGMCEVVMAIRPLVGRWPLTSQQAQRLVLEAFPERMRSALHDDQPKAHTYAYASVGHEGWLRVTTLRRPFTDIAYGNMPDLVTLRMGRYRLEVQGRPWAVRYRDLADQLAKPCGPRLPLEAVSPTRVGIGGEMPLPLPVPWALFVEPAKCWAAFSNETPPPEHLTEWLRRHVSLSACRIETTVLEVEGQDEPGFVGPFELRVARGHERDTEWRWVHVLADYARFTGVGRRRARGAGQLRRAA